MSTLPKNNSNVQETMINHIVNDEKNDTVDNHNFFDGLEEIPNDQSTRKNSSSVIEDEDDSRPLTIDVIKEESEINRKLDAKFCNIYDELVKTEEQYVNHLKDFSQFYLDRLELKETIEIEEFMDNPRIAALFSSMKQIYLLNSQVKFRRMYNRKINRKMISTFNFNKEFYVEYVFLDIVFGIYAICRW